ncbi:universal stress protein [Nitrospira sp. M1]
MNSLKDQLTSQTESRFLETHSPKTSVFDKKTTLPSLNLHRIFHPTDCSAESTLAFVHALKMAEVTGAELRIFRSEQRKEENILESWNDFPQVRTTLAEWGKQLGEPERNQGEELGFHVEKILAFTSNAKNTILQYLRDKHTDLIVLTTQHQHDFCFRSSYGIAEAITSESGVMTLVVPPGCQGFVLPLDGAVTLNRILIPITSTPDPQPAIDAASAMAHTLGNPEGAFTLLHVGCEEEMPKVELPDQPGWTWDTTIRRGKVADEILFEDAEQAFNLIVMTTHGHQNFLDALLGTTTESVMHQAWCPVLVLPTVSSS